MAGAGESVISRVVKVLAAFQGGEASLTVAQIARRSALPVPTAHRLVAELLRWGLLERTSDRQVRVGLRLWELAVRSSPQLFLRDRALPFMEQLQAAVKQHTHLSVLDGTDIVYLERLSAPDAAVNITRVAGRLPAAISAPGLIYAAFAMPAVRGAILAAMPAPLTASTPTRPERLAAIVREVSRTGLAVTEGWIHPDATGLAVPVRGRGGEVAAALSLVLPRSSTLVTSAVSALQAAALATSHALAGESRPGRDPQLSLLEHLLRQGLDPGTNMDR